MASIFELTALETLLLSERFALDDNDPSDADAIKLCDAKIIALHSKMEDRALWAAKMSQGCEAHGDAVAEIVKTRQAAMKRSYREAEYFKNMAFEILKTIGIDEIESDEIRLKMAKTPAALGIAPDFDLRHLPYDLWKEETVITPDKKAIKKWLSDTGIEFDGLDLVSGKTLRIS